MIKENSVFLIGIKGVAMTNLAIILQKTGKKVSGSDSDEEFITDQSLLAHEIKYVNNFREDSLPDGVDLVVYSAAHQGINNPQVQAAKSRRIRIMPQAELIGNLFNSFGNFIAVCGCHGKTTTASLLAYGLINLKKNPSYLIGSPDIDRYDGGDYSHGQYAVIEADEYGVNPPLDKTPKLMFLKPKFILCTNIDFDHPDVYDNLEMTKKAFLKFFNESNAAKILICADDRNSVEIAGKLIKKNYLTYGFTQSADFRIQNLKTTDNGTVFDIVDTEKNTFQFKISLFGEKNVSNAAGAIAVLSQLGISYAEIAQSIKNFSGAKRRFEKVGYKNSIYLFDDYGHHPHEIEATIKAAKDRFPKQRIVVIFQPHTFSRTQSLLNEFSISLSLADLSLLLPIFPSARENPDKFTVKSENIINSQNKDRVFAFNSKKELLEKFRSVIKPGDVIFTMGAGDVYKLKNDIIKEISKL